MENNQEASSSSNLTFNPFEAESLDSLHLPTFSPSVFSTKVKTPANSKKGEFRWSIDQLASLYPADIDENGQQEEVPLDHETEAKVQNTISMFFEEKLHVPSPWSAPRYTGKLGSKSPGHPLSKRCVSEDSPLVRKEVPINQPELRAPATGTQGVDAVCQTVVTLPMDFDLIALLEDKCALYSEQLSQDQSSLRRKLFPLSDASRSLTPNSVSSLARSGSPADQALPSPDLSPVKNEEGGGDRCHLKTPNSAGSQFSSSPLVAQSSLPRAVCTPFTPRGPSPLLRDLGTPLLSPICKDSGTPRTGKPDKRNQSVSFASKLAFTPNMSSSPPPTSSSQNHRGKSPATPSLTNTASDRTRNSSSTMDDYPPPAERGSPMRTSSAAANQVCPELEGQNYRSDFTTSLFAECDANCEKDKLTSTQLVEGNSGNDLTFDLTMNEGDLTAMETSSVLTTSALRPQGSSRPEEAEMRPALRADTSDVSRVPAEKLFVTNGMVQDLERHSGEIVINTLGQVDSGYNTHSLPTISMTGTAVSTTDISGAESLPVLTLSSTGSLPSLSS